MFPVLWLFVFFKIIPEITIAPTPRKYALTATRPEPPNKAVEIKAMMGSFAVLGFVPQMLVLFTFLAFLEACGYMARVAFIMDRIGPRIISAPAVSASAALRTVAVKNSRRKMSVSDRIDSVVTNRWAALPVFAAVMFVERFPPPDSPAFPLIYRYAADHRFFVPNPS